MEKLKKVKINDILGILIFFILIIPAFIKKLYLKCRNKEIWLICEMKNMARDNGFFFFKYMQDRKKDIQCYYVIDKKSNDYKKLKKYNKNVIKWGGFKHYFYFMSATKNISSEKTGNPNHPLFSFLLLYMGLYNNRVFLQHGVLYQNFEMFHKKNSKFKLFICGAKAEYDFVVKKFGYNNDEVKYTGLARFDNLHNIESDNKIILYMPTWRRYLSNKKDLIKSEYFKKIEELLNDRRLNEILETNDKYLYFCPHKGLYKSKDCFKSDSNRVKIIDLENADIQELLIKGALLITDFSSIHTDFAYMHKPILYYQYNKIDYIKHIGQCALDSYFDFERDGFGKVVKDKDSLIKNIEDIIAKNFLEEEIYLKRIKNFFILHDNKNCERIYNEIKNII